MNTTQQGIVVLLKSAVTGEVLPLPETFDLEAALPEVNRHKIHTLIFQGAMNCRIPRDNPAMQQLFQKYCRTLMSSEAQMREVQRIYQAFNENSIDYMPLKGCNMKFRYPKPELRIMGDADILIRMEQYEKIVPIMESLGFTFKCESDHELIWQSKSLFLELHKRLVPSYNRDISPYFEDCWKKARAGSGNCYLMTQEDEWLYLFTHFAKHFRDSGIGCRHVVDLWVFLRSCPALDEGYVEGVLNELRLLEFYENIKRLLFAWFEDGETDETVAVLTQYIFSSGNWGQAFDGVLSSALRNSHRLFGKNARLRHLWSYLFPDLRTMQRRHQVLKAAPWLLPVMWIVRLVYKVLFDKRALRKKSLELSVITEENLQRRHQILNFVGLDYH